MAHFSTSTTYTSTFLSVMANSTIRLNIPKAQTCTNIILIMLNYKNMEFTRLFDFVFFFTVLWMCLFDLPFFQLLFFFNFV